MNINEMKKSISSFYQKIEYYDEIESTSSLLKESLYHEGDVIIADSQSHGRGRNGRSFHSPKGKGIYLSFVIEPELSVYDSLKMTALVGVSLVKAIQKNYSVSPLIKWVNDIIIDDHKIAGILCESILKDGSDKIDKMIIGVGINVHSYNMPDDLQNIAGCIEDFCLERISRQKIIIDFLNIFYDDYKKFDFIDEYRKYSYILNQLITVYENNQFYDAYVLAINDDASLTVLADGKEKVLQSGEISIRKTNLQQNT